MQKKQKKGRPRWRILALPLLATLAVSLFFRWHRGGREAPPGPEADAPTGQAVDLPGLADQLRQAQRENADTVAWLTIPGTDIGGPVVQAADNGYYLRRDALGAEDFRGCIFADYEARLECATLSRNVVIYGHTFSDGGGAFAGLQNYLDPGWADAHREILLTIEDGGLLYEVFSAGLEDTRQSSLPVYCNLSNDEIRQVVELAEARNLLELEDPPTPDQSLLTLATCTVAGSEDERLVVVAKLVDKAMASP